MDEYRRLAAKMDQHMRLLAREGVQDGPTILFRMLGYAPELHTIWTGASDRELKALCDAFPGFFRYATLIEEASEAERAKPSRPYDGLVPLSEENKQRSIQLLTAAASLESGFHALHASGKLHGADDIAALTLRHRQWLAEVEAFTASLRAQGVDPRGIGYVEKAFTQMAERIQKLARG